MSALTVLDGAIIGIPIGICIAVLAYGAIFRPPHCELCEQPPTPQDLLPPGVDYRDPLVADVLASQIRPCAKRRQLERIAGAGAPRGGARR